jgi:hypothetical protein
MYRDELCANLNGREYTEEINEELETIARISGLVVVFGASDDLMEFRGAIDDEVGCYNGCTAYLTKDGLLVNKCDEDDCPYFDQIKKQALTIEATWNTENESEIAWTYKTKIPHSTFEIMEDGVIYCRGIVFSLSDLGVEKK